MRFHYNILFVSVRALQQMGIPKGTIKWGVSHGREYIIDWYAWEKYAAAIPNQNLNSSKKNKKGWGSPKRDGGQTSRKGWVSNCSYSKSKAYISSLWADAPSWSYVKGLDGDGRTSWVIYDTIPASTRSKLPSPEQLIHTALEEQSQCLTKVVEALMQTKYRQEHAQLYESKGLPTEASLHFSYQVAMVRTIKQMLAEYVSKGKIHPRAGRILTKAEMWDAFVEVWKKHAGAMNSVAYLRKRLHRIEQYEKDKGSLVEAVINGRYGNQNARKIGIIKVINETTGQPYDYDIHQLLTFGLWRNADYANKLSKAEVYRRYVDICGQLHIAPLSTTSVDRLLVKNRHWLSWIRDGEDAFKNIYAPYIVRDKLRYAGSKWAADWSGTNLSYVDRTGKVSTLYMLRIYDVATTQMVGWEAIERNDVKEKGRRGEPGWESHPAMSVAFERAVQHQGGRGCMELLTDNASCFTSERSRRHLRAICVNHRTISIGNKRANEAEQMIYAFNQFCRTLSNWSMSGFRSGIAGKLDSVANPDAIVKELLPNYTQAYAQIEAQVQAWNADKSSKPYHPALSPLSHLQRRRAFGRWTTKGVGNSQGKIRVKGDYVEHLFDAGDYQAFLDKVKHKTTDRAMTVRMIWDKTGADLYTNSKKEKDMQHICTILPVQKSHKTTYEATPDTRTGYRTQLAQKEKYTQDVANRHDDLSRIAAELELPYLQATMLNKGKGKEVQLAQQEHINPNKKTTKKKNIKSKQQNEHSTPDLTNSDLIDAHMRNQS